VRVFDACCVVGGILFFPETNIYTHIMSKKLSERNPEGGNILKRRNSGALEQYKHLLLEEFAGSFNDIVDIIPTLNF